MIKLIDYSNDILYNKVLQQNDDMRCLRKFINSNKYKVCCTMRNMHC